MLLIEGDCLLQYTHQCTGIFFSQQCDEHLQILLHVRHAFLHVLPRGVRHLDVRSSAVMGRGHPFDPSLLLKDAHHL